MNPGTLRFQSMSAGTTIAVTSHIGRAMAARAAKKTPQKCKKMLSQLDEMQESQLKSKVAQVVSMRPVQTGVTPGIGASLLVSAAASIISVNFIHPIELVKTRVQVAGLPLLTTIGDLLRTEGYTALYKGIKPAWLREGSYTALKMGMYAPTRDLIASWDGTDRQATPMEVRMHSTTTGSK